jgi:hypothetical protein
MNPQHGGLRPTAGISELQNNETGLQNMSRNLAFGLKTKAWVHKLKKKGSSKLRAAYL